MTTKTVKAVKGKRGFLTIPDSKKQTKRLTFYITEAQSKRLEAYCKKEGTFYGLVVKERIKDIIGTA